MPLPTQGTYLHRRCNVGTSYPVCLMTEYDAWLHRLMSQLGTSTLSFHRRVRHMSLTRVTPVRSQQSGDWDPDPTLKPTHSLHTRKLQRVDRAWSFTRPLAWPRTWELGQCIPWEGTSDDKHPPHRNRIFFQITTYSSCARLLTPWIDLGATNQIWPQPSRKCWASIKNHRM